MGLLSKFFKAEKSWPEDGHIVTITSDMVGVEHPKWQMGKVEWKDIHTILLINNDKGPSEPDVWLTLIGDNGKCMIPQGAKGFDEVYGIVSRYEGFNFENAIKSMSCAENAEFMLWAKRGKNR